MKSMIVTPCTSASVLLLGLLLTATLIQSAQAYEDYGGCKACHGNFRGPTSTKGTIFPNNNNHDMHRNAANMDAECNLCHTGSSRVPTFIGTSNGTANNPGIGCTGCHVAAGLQLHHLNNGVSECLDCHDAAVSAPETVKPPYYGTADTKARNPGNTVLLANTNENWSVGDFLGLDNDGNNHYDLADYAVGPFQLLSVKPEGNNLRVTWLTAGGRTNTVQAAVTSTGTYTNISSALVIPGVGFATNSFVEIGGATNRTRFYRLNAVVP
jgi:hypothetical protein